MLDEEDYKKIDSIIDNSIVIEDVSKDEGFGEEIKEIAREFTDRFTTAFLKNRMNIFIIVLIIIFLFLVGIRLINYVGM